MPGPRLRRSLSVVIAAVILGIGAAPAYGDSVTRQILGDCTSQASLLGHYSVSQLRRALQVMTPEEKEYTSCPDVINRAILSAVGGGHGSHGGTGGSSGSFLPTPVIVVLVLLVLAGVTLAAVAARRRAGPGDGENTPLH